jgi:hypothetical protein
MLEEFKIEMMKSKKIPIISRDKLVKLGSVCGIKDFKTVLECAKYLHDVGSIVYFANDPTLADIVVLEPRWLTQVPIHQSTNPPIRQSANPPPSNLPNTTPPQATSNKQQAMGNKQQATSNKQQVATRNKQQQATSSNKQQIQG